MTRIYLVRHVEAEGNLYRICEGWYDGLLTPFGRTQLPCLTERFRGVHLDAVYASDLYRALETGRAVAASSGLPVESHPGLRELGFGAWEGVSWGDIYDRWPAARHQFYEDYRHFAAPEGENTLQAAKRFTAAVRELAARHPGGTIAVVSHSGVLGAFFPYVEDGLTGERGIQYMHNGAVSLAETDGETFRILDFDDVSHLGEHEAVRRSNIQFTFRTADARQDEEYLLACGKDAWQAVYGSLSGFVPERFLANTRGTLEADPANGFIPMYEGKPAGLLLLDSRQDDEAYTGHISLIYLRPEFRGMGLGAQLMGRAVIEYRARGMRTLRLNVAAVNRTAQRFYERIGFVRAPQLRSIVTRQQVMKLDIRVPHEKTRQ